MKDKLIKDSEYNISIELLQTEFVKSYAKKKGWNTAMLTEEQLNEIKNQEGYKSPILKS